MEKDLFKLLFILLFILSFLLQFFFYRKLQDKNESLRKEKEGLAEQNQSYLERMHYMQQENFYKKMHEMEMNLRKELYNSTHQNDQNLLKLNYQLQKLDQQHLKIEDVSKELLSLQDVLQNKSSRGIFGEMHLNQILESVFGSKNEKLYALQYRFSTGRQADAVVFAPKPLGTIAIDSKFPLENYERMLRDQDDKKNRQMFEQDIKKHIDDIADRYIIEGETASHAMMFIPAEAVYAQIYAYHQSLVHYAQERSVWIVSPSTLISSLSMIQTIALRIQQNEEAEKVEMALKKLAIEFERYQERWGQFSNRLERFTEDAHKIQITSQKISKEFNRILDMDFRDDDN